MPSIQIHQVIYQLISLFKLTGIWYRSDVPTAREVRLKAFYFLYYLLFFLSLAGGAITNRDLDEGIFLTELSIVLTVLIVKFWILIFKQKEIVEFLNRICVFSVRNNDTYNFFNDKLDNFLKFIVAFLCAAFIMICCAIVIIPFIGSKRRFIANIAFPMDYKNNEIAFWIALIFLISEGLLSFLAIVMSTVIWYLMFHCSLRYEVIGQDIKDMGRDVENKKISQQEKHKQFFYDLKASIVAQHHLKELINEMASFTSDLFLIQFGTSGLCICGSIYCLAYHVGNSYFESLYQIYTLFYNIAELFMIAYFGNEIELSSSRLTYKLFESNWIGQPQTTKKCLIIFGEYLNQSHVLLIGKLYPLILVTFTRILNTAYRLFNILKNTKQW